jgi:hypothetical protein
MTFRKLIMLASPFDICQMITGSICAAITGVAVAYPIYLISEVYESSDNKDHLLWYSIILAAVGLGVWLF